MKQRWLLNTACVALLGAGLAAVATPGLAAPVASAAGVHQTIVVRMFGPSAIANFVDQYTDPATGQVVHVTVTISISQGNQSPPGKPAGAMEGVSLIEYTNTEPIRSLNGAGAVPVPAGTTIDAKNLTFAHSPATMVVIRPTGDNPDAFDPYVAHIGAVGWTGAGPLVVSPRPETIHLRASHACNVTMHSSGASRTATAVTGPLSYLSPLTHTDVTLTHLTNNPGPFEFPTELANGRATTVVVLHAPIEACFAG